VQLDDHDLKLNLLQLLATAPYSKIAIFAHTYDWQTAEDGSEGQKQAKTTFFHLQSMIFFWNQRWNPFLYTNGKLNFQGFQRCQKTWGSIIFLKSYIGRNVKFRVKFPKFRCHFLSENRFWVLKTPKCSIFNFKKIGATKIEI